MWQLFYRLIIIIFNHSIDIKYSCFFFGVAIIYNSRRPECAADVNVAFFLRQNNFIYRREAPLFRSCWFQVLIKLFTW